MIRIFANDARECAGRNAARNYRPSFAVIGGLIEIRLKIIQLVFGSREVSRGGVERRGFDGVDLHPFRQAFRRDVFPVLAAVLGDVHQAVIGAGPDQPRLHWRFRHGENYVVVFDAGVVFGDRSAGWPLLGFIVAREVARDHFPACAAVGGFEDVVAGAVQRVRIVGRGDNRIGPLEAVLHGFGARAHGIIGPDGDVAKLPSAMVVAREQTIVRAGVNDVGILGIGRQPAALAAADVVPIAHADAALIAASCDADGAVILLRAVSVIREIVVQRDSVELRSWLLILRGPGAAAVGAHVGAAVVRFDHAIGIVGRHPEIMNVAVGRANGVEGFAGIVRAIEAGVHREDRVRFQRIGENARVIPGALTQLAFLVHFGPGFTGVVRAEHAAVFGFHQRPHAFGIHGRDRHADASEDAFGHAGIAAEIGPGIAAVGGFPDAAIRAAAIETPGLAARFPEAGVEHARIRGVHGKVDRAGVGTAREDLLPRSAAIGGAVDAAHFIGSPEMAQRGHVDDVGIPGMHADRADVKSILQADVLPSLARVSGFVNAVAM